MKDRALSMDTLAIHAGYAAENFHGAAVPPIFHTTTYLQNEHSPTLRYHRLHNSPQHDIVSARISALEHTEDALVVSSGMAAISNTLLALTEAGDHIIAQGSLYGGTHHYLMNEWARDGRKVSFFDWGEATHLEEMITSKTKIIYVEGLSNPLIRAHDFRHIVKVAKAHNVLTVIDNTVPSPVNFQPARIGIDVVVHSATKYLNGHSDVIAGSIAGPKKLVDKIRTAAKYYGASLDAQSLALLLRGMKTMPLRVRTQNASAQRLAETLERHPRVRHVSYPGLPSHPDHAMLCEMMQGFGGMFSFELDGRAKDVTQFLAALTLFLSAPSLGSVESLITVPVRSSHSNVSEQERLAQGITESLIRVAVGIEGVEDLEADLLQALGKLS